MKIGFIGLGIMGSRMAANLLQGGVELVIHNRTKDKATSLLEQGAVWAENLSDMAAVDIVFTMLAHPEAVAAIALGPDGFLDHLPPGKLWIDCSTVNPSFARDMAAAAQARGIRHVDAPVAGTKPQAQNAELVFIAGGEASDVAEADPYFKLMGQRVAHVGGHGMGVALKVVVNAMLGASMVVFAESMALGQALGLSQEILLNTVVGSAVAAPFLAGKRPKIEQDDYEAQFPLRWMQKDMHLAAVAAYEAGAAMPVANATKELYRLADQKGLGDEDFCAIYKFLRQ
ncbi:MAG: NAD(P)-dependent oxidoreductase [Anaerolineaceae bacterium]|nr:NAD(P)-dependent oxidoreductase [Anaerolineaceae bacterium]MCB9101246.1 NAD(P)-dependent oxidoreductase [Anaerolineales bacterium]